MDGHRGLCFALLCLLLKVRARFPAGPGPARPATTAAATAAAADAAAATAPIIANIAAAAAAGGGGISPRDGSVPYRQLHHGNWRNMHTYIARGLQLNHPMNNTSRLLTKIAHAHHLLLEK